MGKRYRSLRKEFKMTIAPGQTILWHGFRYPPKSGPSCTDKKIISAIESRQGFGQMFWEEVDPESILIDPQAVPDDCEAAILQKAARRLVTMGYNVNPKLLKKEEEPQLPSKTFISTAKRSELEAMIKRFGWEIDSGLNAKDLKKAVRAKVEELSTQEE